MDKKVLLRERKRHTARRVVSTPSVVLPGYPPRGGVPSQVPPGGGGVPGTPPGEGGTRSGTPLGGYPDPPPLPHGILGNVAKHYGIWVPPQVWTDKQSETITFPSYYVRGR